MSEQYPKIENPEFVDFKKTRVRFFLVREDGVKTVAELMVPENGELGKNEHWDQIVASFDVEEMRKKRDNIERKMRIEYDLNEKKKKSAVENRALQFLFDRKLQFFNQHFVKDLTQEEKSTVRRASNEVFLNLAIQNAIQNYLQRTGKSLLELLDEIEDEQYKKLDEENK